MNTRVRHLYVCMCVRVCVCTYLSRVIRSHRKFFSVLVDTGSFFFGPLRRATAFSDFKGDIIFRGKGIRGTRVSLDTG